ncbi:MAG: hypothetical protein LBC59_09220 [Chitinispirillales bacterium]|jgi:hypothetical protein|nr:hypothetical protein [Chitinispirillales bacterium]
MADGLETYKKYAELGYEKTLERAEEIVALFGSYMQEVGIANHDMRCSRHSLCDVIDRVDKRKVYFRVFYDKVKDGMSERNEAALYCFWILKLSPFFDNTCPDIEVNINFAAWLLLASVKHSCNKNGIAAISLPDKYVGDLKYAFRFRDISKESMMALAETMYEVLAGNNKTDNKEPAENHEL